MMHVFPKFLKKRWKKLKAKKKHQTENSTRRPSPATEAVLRLSPILEGSGIKVGRARVAAHINHLLKLSGIEGGSVLEIGAFRRPMVKAFPSDRFNYTILEMTMPPRHTIPMLQGDITHCPQIPDNSFDVVISIDVFEHIDKPWLAAQEIQRILKPGGLAYTRTVFSWRYHPVPFDYWRFTPEALELIFDGMETIEAGFDISERRNKAMDVAVPDDEYGGFIENWRVFHVGRKPA